MPWANWEPLKGTTDPSQQDKSSGMPCHGVKTMNSWFIIILPQYLVSKVGMEHLCSLLDCFVDLSLYNLRTLEWGSLVCINACSEHYLQPYRWTSEHMFIYVWRTQVTSCRLHHRLATKEQLEVSAPNLLACCQPTVQYASPEIRRQYFCVWSTIC